MVEGAGVFVWGKFILPGERGIQHHLVGLFSFTLLSTKSSTKDMSELLD